MLLPVYSHAPRLAISGSHRPGQVCRQETHRTVAPVQHTEAPHCVVISDVMVYTSEALTEDVTVAGPVRATVLQPSQLAFDKMTACRSVRGCWSPQPAPTRTSSSSSSTSTRATSSRPRVVLQRTEGRGTARGRSRLVRWAASSSSSGVRSSAASSASRSSTLFRSFLESQVRAWSAKAWGLHSCSAGDHGSIHSLRVQPEASLSHDTNSDSLLLDSWIVDLGTHPCVTTAG